MTAEKQAYFHEYSLWKVEENLCIYLKPGK